MYGLRGFVGIDFETHLIKPGCKTPKPVCLSASPVDGSVKIFLRDEAGAFLTHLFTREKEVEIVGHNIMFDLGVAIAEWPHLLEPVFDALEAGRVHCTMIRQKLIDIAAGESEFRVVGESRVKASLSLAALGKYYFSEVWDKGDDTYRLRFAELDGVPLARWPGSARAYVLEESDRPLRVYAAQVERVRRLKEAQAEHEVWPDGAAIPNEREQTQAAFWLHLMSTWGLRTDPEKVALVKHEFERAQKTICARLIPHGLIRPDGTRDTKAIRARVVAAYNDSPPRTDKGAVKMDGDTLERSKDPELIALGKTLSEAATLNTWLPHLESGTRVPICTEYNVLVDSGRTSSRAPNCFDKDTEVLTRSGWVKFPELQHGVEVAQWDHGQITFVEPIEHHRYRFNGKLELLQNLHINLAVTPDHRCLLQHRKTGEYRVFSAAEYPEDWKQLHGGVLRERAKFLLSEDQLILLCAVQADGYWNSGGVDFSFSKQRKIDRLLQTLDRLGAPYSVAPKRDRQGCLKIRLKKGQHAAFCMTVLGPHKEFGPWVLQLGRERLDHFCEEVFRWDGCITRMNHYSSNSRTNADWVQAALSLSGGRARMRVYRGKRNPNYQVDITHRNYSFTTNIRRTKKRYCDYVYCVSVPSSYLLVRRGGEVCITGNCQNPPRHGDIRPCFVARKGYVYSFCDYDTAELRALAQICIWLVGYSELGEALKRGEDPHLSLAAQLEGTTYEDALARKKAGDKRIIEARGLAKVGNFGFPGGLGVDAFVDYAHGYDPRYRDLVDRAVSANLRDAWFRRWSEMRKFFSIVHASLGQVGEAPVQQFVSRRVRYCDRFTAAANTTFQGLVADGAKAAGWSLAKECYLGVWTSPPEGDSEEKLFSAGAKSPLFGARPVVFLHDEFGLEVPTGRGAGGVHLAAMRQARVQRCAMKRFIPDIPITCAPTLTRRWYKGAEAVFVDKKHGEYEKILACSKPVVQENGDTRWVVDEF